MKGPFVSTGWQGREGVMRLLGRGGGTRREAASTLYEVHETCACPKVVPVVQQRLLQRAAMLPSNTKPMQYETQAHTSRKSPLLRSSKDRVRTNDTVANPLINVIAPFRDRDSGQRISRRAHRLYNAMRWTNVAHYDSDHAIRCEQAGALGIMAPL